MAPPYPSVLNSIQRILADTGCAVMPIKKMRGGNGMRWVGLVAAMLTAFTIWCLCRASGEADRKMEEIWRRKEDNE